MYQKRHTSCAVAISRTEKLNSFYSEFGLCNPTPYLAYLYTQKCQSLKQLSNQYRIDGKK